MKRRREWAVLALIVLSTVSMGGCERENRDFHGDRGAKTKPDRERLVRLVPGPYTADVRVRNPYQRNAFAISEGKRLYNWYNCVGCHSHGGGGMGPPLMDDKWIYGSDPEQIFSTIVEGRPNGMPSFRGKIPDYQVWQLVAYVQSLSGLVPKDAANGRDDHMFVKKPEAQTPDLLPRGEAARHP
jgi:cytochrome c oxidase cbb3-type subunit 3